MQIKLSLIVKESRSWLGTPWRHCQQVKGVKGGIDCVRFLYQVAKTCGVDLEDLPSYYDRLARGNDIINYLENHFEKIPIQDRQFGDILVFKCLGIPHHVGLCVPIGTEKYKGVIHASSQEKRIVETTLDGPLLNSLVAVYRAPDIIDDLDIL
jgi:cell wall-associated NlpC family hydrolase